MTKTDIFQTTFQFRETSKSQKTEIIIMKVEHTASDLKFKNVGKRTFSKPSRRSVDR